MRLLAKQLILVYLVFLPTTGFATLVGDEIEVDVRFSYSVFGIGVGASSSNIITVDDGIDLSVAFRSLSYFFPLIGYVTVIDNLDFEVDVLADSILIRASSAGTFFGDTGFTFSSLDWNGNTMSRLVAVEIVEPIETAPSLLELSFDSNSLSLQVLNDEFSSSPFSEIVLNLTFVPISTSSIAFLFIPLSIILMTATGRASSGQLLKAYLNIH